MNARYTGWMIAMLFFAAACGGTTAKDGLTKSEARALVESGDADDTVCSDNGFNDDGECDDWCPDGDAADCPVSNTCGDGDTKTVDCNDCVCSDGNWACTEKACDNNDPANNGSGVCSDGDTKQVECNTCSCLDGAWACTEIACGPNNTSSDVLPLEIRECDRETDAFETRSAKIQDDTLIVDVAYSGGCAEHVFTPCWDGTFMESFPVQARLVLEHDANGDRCEAYPQETLKIDLSEMKESYLSGYQATDGTIILHTDDQTVDYTF